jgi:hypothetical protein
MLDRLGILDAEGNRIDRNSFYIRKGINEPWLKIKQNNIENSKNPDTERKEKDNGSEIRTSIFAGRRSPDVDCGRNVF